MRRQELIDMLKQAWTTALLDEKDLREDIAESYAAWVQGLIQSAAPELSGQQQGQGQQQGGAPAQGAAAPPEQGGGAPMPQAAGAESAGGMM